MTPATCISTSPKRAVRPLLIEEKIVVSQKETAELALSLNRDVLWLERELRNIAKAKACGADRLREIAAEALEKAKKRRKRTMTR